VRLLATAAALLCALAVLPSSATAKTGKPFDFEVAAPAPLATASAAGARVVSQRIATRRRFNLVGLRWRGSAEPAIAVRVRRARGGWSHWQRIAAHADHNPDPGASERIAGSSDPLWVGSADAVQYRLSRRVAGLRLHFVNVGRYARPRLRAAQDVEPDFVSRSEWGASQCKPREKPLYGTVKAVIVHHTVSLNDYTPAEAPAIVLAVCRYHRNSNGWNDIGYNALVDKYGVLYEGRAGGLDRAVVGAQAQGFNSETAGIASIADHTTVEATPETLNAIARYARWKLAVHFQPLSGKVTLTSAGGPESRYGAGVKVRVPRVLGHRDTGRTACPGNLLYRQLAELRTMVETGVGAAPAITARLSAALADTSIDYGETVPVTGVLAAPDGLPLAAAPVEVQTNAEGRWVTTKHLVSAADGTFGSELRPRKRMYVRLRFPGEADLRGATSVRLLLRLHPVVELKRPARRARPGRRVAVRGTVGPRKRSLRLMLQQRVRGRFTTVGRKAVRARRGRFSTSFVPAFRADYRYAVVAKSDADTDRGSTGWRTLRVR
jgi:N-acetylmuramoyl-L-alanine amidase-like protein